MHRSALLLLLMLTAPALALTPAQQKQLDVKLTIEGRTEHPIVYMTREDVARAKVNREKYPWAKKAAEKLLREADEWAAKSDDELIALVPPPKSCYAYGFTGCPVCGGTLAAWWGQDGVASLHDPRHIKCVNGHRLPDEKHPDSGEGYVGANGRKYYFVGTYNSYVIDTLTTATTKLVHAYALTGDQKYAGKAALILDHLARIYPTSETGSWDYPSNPPSGRFNRPWYQVARTLVFYANQYDILMMSDALSKPSSVEGMTRRENIEKNMLLNGAAYCYRQSVIHPALHNGQADYIRGPMAVAAAMGIKQYIDWGVDGPYGIRAMIANNVDRDGLYYETSSLYSNHARSLYIDMAEIARHWTDAKYPDGIDLTRDPVFVLFNRLPMTRLRCATMQPSLGDDGPNVKRVATTQAIDPRDIANLERLADLGGETYSELTEAARSESQIGEWLLFHARELRDREDAKALREREEKSDLFSQKGLAILRSGMGENARAATLRFGPTLNHGHLDEMGINIYARGYEMTYDLGYGLGSTHTQVGWAHTTASHNTVVIDETPQLKTGRSGGTLKAFVTGPGVTIAQADDPAAYGVEKYERTLAMIDIDDKLSYLVDVFHVKGGSKHDYVFHAMGTDLVVEGLELGAPAKGSLAGETIDWGDRIGSDGNVIGVEGKDYWNPPPGNGYGFLMHPRSAAGPSDVWSATWTIDGENAARMRLNVLPMPGAKIITCEAPGIYPKFPKSAYLLARSEGTNLESVFASVIEPYDERRGVKSISRQSTDDGMKIRVELIDGRTDEVIWSTQRGMEVRRADGTVIKSSFPGIGGVVERIDYEKNILYTRATLLPGKLLHVANPAYAQTSVFRIASIAEEGGLTAIRLAPTRLTLGKGHMDADPSSPTALPNVTPLEYAKSLAHKPSGFFRGKRVTTPTDSAETRIVDTDAEGLVLTVQSSQGFKAGNDLMIYDVSAGDSMRVSD